MPENIELDFQDLISDVGRKQLAIRKLRRILGFGDPIFRSVLPPEGMSRDEYIEMRESAGEGLDLPDDIVSIVAEMRSPKALCDALTDFQPKEAWRNYKKIQDAAPDISLATQLRDIWSEWFGYSWFAAPVMDEASTGPAVVYEKVEGGICSDFLVRAMLDQYLDYQQIDFDNLFPPCEEQRLYVRDTLKRKVAREVAHYFKEALKRELPDRPDLLYYEAARIRRLKQELMESANARVCVRLTVEIFQAMTAKVACDGCESKFYRRQRERHFLEYL